MKGNWRGTQALRVKELGQRGRKQGGRGDMVAGEVHRRRRKWQLAGPVNWLITHVSMMIMGQRRGRRLGGGRGAVRRVSRGGRRLISQGRHHAFTTLDDGLFHGCWSIASVKFIVEA